MEASLGDDEHSAGTSQVVGGKYRLLRVLGQGGMGIVYEAENLLTLQRAAIKWHHQRGVPGADSERRMLREARAMARVHHPNVVRVYDVIVDENAVLLVMELLIGESLGARISRDVLTLGGMLRTLLEAMRGVSAAHVAGVVHRDIKPENIFLAEAASGEPPVPKIIDFGISHVAEPAAQTLTRSGMTMGTPCYVSYEQLRGVRNIDGRADIYAFAVILYECASGRPPYAALTFSQQAIAFATSEPTPLAALCPELPPALCAVVMRGVAADRELRWQSIDDFAAALAPFAADPALERALVRCGPRATRTGSLDIYPHDADTGPLGEEAISGHAPTGPGQNATRRAGWPRWTQARVVGALAACLALASLVQRGALETSAGSARAVPNTTATAEPSPRTAGHESSLQPIALPVQDHVPESATLAAPSEPHDDAPERHSSRLPLRRRSPPRVQLGPSLSDKAPPMPHTPGGAASDGGEATAVMAENETGTSVVGHSFALDASTGVAHRGGLLRRSDF